MGSRRRTILTCSFCGKEPRDIILMMASDGEEHRICNECLFQGMAVLAHSDQIDFDALVAAAKREDAWKDVGPEGAGSA